jgi:hypothetical protein
VLGRARREAATFTLVVKPLWGCIKRLVPHIIGSAIIPPVMASTNTRLFPRSRAYPYVTGDVAERLKALVC